MLRLVLDKTTSALDSEIERDPADLGTLMAGKA
jgi:hypothetical protein